MPDPPSHAYGSDDADVWTGGLLRPNESTVPEILLAPRLDAPLRELLRAFRSRSDDELRCAPRWDAVPKANKRDWIARLARKRMASKHERLAEPSNRTLEERLHERLFAGLSYAKNEEPVSTLAERLPPDRVRSLNGPQDLLDADRTTADYAMDLRDRYRRLQVRHDVPGMNETAWTFFRLRPNNFPPLRIAQAVAWYDEGALLAIDPLPRLRSALEADASTAALRKIP